MSNRIYAVGECCAVDIKYWTVPDVSGNLGSLHAIDSETFLIPHHKNLIDYVVIIIDRWLRDGHIMEEMRMDDEFVTEDINSVILLKHSPTLTSMDRTVMPKS